MSKIIKQILQEEEDDEKSTLNAIRLRLVDEEVDEAVVEKTTTPLADADAPELEVFIDTELLESPAPAAIEPTAVAESVAVSEPEVAVEPIMVASEPQETQASLDYGIREALKKRPGLFQRKPKELKKKSERPFNELEAVPAGIKHRSYAYTLVVLIIVAGVGAYITKKTTPVVVQNLEPTIPIQHSAGASPSLILANHDAVILFRKQKYKDALKVLEPLIQQNPEFSGLYVNLAAVEMKLGDLKKAKKSLEHALKLDSKNATALNNLGTLDLENKKWATAQESFKRSLEINPSLEDTRLNYAKSLELGGKTENAIQEYETYIAHAGTDPIFGNLLKKRVLKLKSMVEYIKKSEAR